MKFWILQIRSDRKSLYSNGGKWFPKTKNANIIKDNPVDSCQSLEYLKLLITC